MGFLLTIEEGKELGREYTFDQPEVTIGRTAENDIVLVDPGVSRRHAMIRDEGGRFFVQDLGSANGTQVNGNPSADEEVQSGDEISVGPVIFRFEASASDDGSTRILDASALMPPKPARGSDEDLAEVRRKTTALPIRRPQQSLARPNPAPEKPAAPAAPARRRPAPIVKAAAKGPAALSASERARVLRENKGLGGRIKLFLMEKPPAVRNGIFGGAGLLGLVLLGVVVKLALPDGGPLLDRPDVGKIAFSLGESQEGKVFGFGDHLEVTELTQNEVRFEFEHSDTIPIVYYIGFESRGIERQDEVDISLNGVSMGSVTPGLGDYAKEQRIKLPRKHLKTGIPNEIIFDNTFNPPGAEPWAISKVNLKMVPLPGCRPDGECEREAKKHYDLADVLWAQRQIDAGNTYNCWQNLNKALLFLEAVEPKPSLYNLVQSSLRDAERELDSLCSKTFLESKKFEELGQWDRALKEYKAGLKWFPGEDHSCRSRLQDKILEYG